MSRIEGIATVLPKTRFDLSTLSDTFENLPRVMKSTGIREIRIADPARTASDYCFDAAEYLIDQLGIDRHEIDGLIFVTHSPDYLDPNTSAILQHRLNLSNKTIAMDLNFGCTGFVNGIFQAHVLIESGFCHRVLLLAGDTLTRKVGARDRSSRIIFGDAASATLISKSEDRMEFATYIDGSRFDRIMIPAGGSRIPHKPGVTDIPHDDGHGNFRSLEDHFMDGAAIFDFALDEIPPVIDEVLEKSNWKTEDVDLFGFHQANRSILKNLAVVMKIPLEKVPITLESTGNTLSASIPLMLGSIFKDRRQIQLDKVVLCGFGSGLACSAVAANLSQTKIFPTIESR